MRSAKAAAAERNRDRELMGVDSAEIGAEDRRPLHAHRGGRGEIASQGSVAPASVFWRYGPRGRARHYRAPVPLRWQRQRTLLRRHSRAQRLSFLTSIGDSLKEQRADGFKPERVIERDGACVGRTDVQPGSEPVAAV